MLENRTFKIIYETKTIHIDSLSHSLSKYLQSHEGIQSISIELIMNVPNHLLRVVCTSHLTHLSVKMTFCSAAALLSQSFTNAISNCTNLTSLQLIEFSHHDHGIGLVFKANTQLETIICTKCDLTDDCVQQICRSCTKLQFLEIENTCISDTTLFMLKQSCKELLTLKLTGNNPNLTNTEMEKFISAHTCDMHIISILPQDQVNRQPLRLFNNIIDLASPLVLEEN